MMGCFLAGVREFHSVQPGLSPHNIVFSGYQQHLARGKLFQGVKLTPCHAYSGSVKMCCAVLPLPHMPSWHGTALK
jgi:hypothetical protein